jgi:hypothetical protein
LSYKKTTNSGEVIKERQPHFARHYSLPESYLKIKDMTEVITSDEAQEIKNRISILIDCLTAAEVK